MFECLMLKVNNSDSGEWPRIQFCRKLQLIPNSRAFILATRISEGTDIEVFRNKVPKYLECFLSAQKNTQKSAERKKHSKKCSKKHSRAYLTAERKTVSQFKQFFTVLQRDCPPTVVLPFCASAIIKRLGTVAI